MPERTTPIATEPLAVNSKTAAILLNSTDASLEKDRATGHMGIPYVKAGRRVVYRLAELDAWLKANQIAPGKSSALKASDAKQGEL
jgi:hypothetical protein